MKVDEALRVINEHLEVVIDPYGHTKDGRSLHGDDGVVLGSKECLDLCEAFGLLSVDLERAIPRPLK